jgi:hypothetical protein
MTNCPLSRLFLTAGAMTFLATCGWASSFTIVPTFDSTITSLPDASTVESTINTVIGVYEATFADPITVNITFANMGSGLGQSNFNLYPVTYSTFLSALTADVTSANDSTAVASLPQTTNNPVSGTPNMFIKAADAAALGINIGTPPASDGTISVNLGLTTTGNGTTSGSYSLTSVLEHEVDEILGLGSSLDLQSSYPSYMGYVSPEDLFRYSGTPGVRSYTDSSAVNAYFSIDGGKTDLAQFNNPQYSSCTTSCGDYGDWASGKTPQVQDAFGTPGSSPTPGVETVALDAIGYNLTSSGNTLIVQAPAATPEPATWLLFGTGMLALACFCYLRGNDRRGSIDTNCSTP